ncbi:MAG: hypothetical protein ACI8TP_000624 [Acidimicrobiales bacterium]|jgi:hypothetical protein
MILLEEAVERYALVASDFGISVSRRKKIKGIGRQLGDLERAMGGLRLPAELHHLWSTWLPQSFGSLFFDGLYRVDEVRAVHDRDTALGYPMVCAPMAYIEKAGVWVELETPEHPGGRIYHTYYDQAELQLWCVGVSDLLHLVSETIESGGVNDPDSARPWLDHGIFESVRLDQTVDLLAMPDEWRIDVQRPDTWPGHWQGVQGDAHPSSKLQGRTHSIAEFDKARDRGRVSGTLVGEVTGLITGGPIDGTVATIADDSGSIQVYASVEVERAFAELVVGSRREIDVIGEPAARGLRPRKGTRNFMLRRKYEELSANQLRLLEQMRKLDVTVAATAVRTL